MRNCSYSKDCWMSFTMHVIPYNYEDVCKRYRINDKVAFGEIECLGCLKVDNHTLRDVRRMVSSFLYHQPRPSTGYWASYPHRGKTEQSLGRWG